MLSFEEFFVKKKIDLTALKAGKPALYEEFLAHYEQMGEKSFDHTKKYWFNKLRMDYKLPEAPPAPVLEKEITKAPAPNVTTSETAATKPSGFKPRFKAKITPTVESSPKVTEQPKEEHKPTTAEQPATTKPTGFKPRFKAGITNTKPTEKPEQEVEQKPKEEFSTKPEETSEAKPLGFKPRFKAGVTKSKPKDEE